MRWDDSGPAHSDEGPDDVQSFQLNGGDRYERRG